MEQRFKAGINRLYANGMVKHTIVAVSGGIDSVVLAALYKVSDVPFSIAHCNFQLRGDASDTDEEFVIGLGKKMGVEVFVKHFETGKYANEHGVSIQMAARELRYTWFKTLAIEQEAMIAIAHHANDVAETMLFNLAKGTGIAGLHGISENDGIHIRPLRWAKKEEIEAYAREKNIAWRQDISNESEKYMRNVIRRKVIPELERVNPAFVEASLRTSSRIKDAEDFIRHAIIGLGVIENKEGHVFINKEILKKIPGNRSVLYLLISTYGFNYEQVNSIIKSIDRSGAVFFSDEWVLNIDREFFIISKHRKKSVEMQINAGDNILALESYNLQLQVLPAKGYDIINDQQVAAIDFDKLKFPLTLRNWQQGDTFRPLGMQGKKKVSDFMIDEKIPVNLKQDILVLISNANIAWVVGARIDNRYKISASTKNIYQITIVRQAGQ